MLKQINHSLSRAFAQRIVILLSMTIANHSLLQGQTGNALQDSIDVLLSSWNSQQAPGISLAVVRDGKTLYQRSLGMANIKEGIPVDSATRFWVASVTKQFTAAAIYQLASRNKISLNQSIRYYLPDLPSIYQSVTIDQLIHHTSGIRDGFVLTALSRRPPSEYTNENVLRYLKSMGTLNFQPGTRFEYNNSGYVLLATVIEKVSDQSYPTYMKDSIFLPLGMTQTYISPNFPTDKNQAEGYHQTSTNTYQEYHFEGNTYGSTGVLTSISDLTRWSSFLQNSTDISEFSTVRSKLLEPGKLVRGPYLAYAGGLEKIRYHGRELYEHFGADEGFKADLLYFPSSKLTVMAMVNNSSYYDLLKLLYRVSDIVHEEQLPGPVDIDETGALQHETFYYDNLYPRFIRILSFPHMARISNTFSGYAAPYQQIGDTLRSLDPVPVQYLRNSDKLLFRDPTDQNISTFQQIKLVERIDDLGRFEGEYYSKELETSYRIIKSDTKLQFEFMPGVVFDLVRLTDSDFQFEFQGANYVQFSKIGFSFSREGIRKLFFKRK